MICLREILLINSKTINVFENICFASFCLSYFFNIFTFYDDTMQFLIPCSKKKYFWSVSNSVMYANILNEYSQCAVVDVSNMVEFKIIKDIIHINNIILKHHINKKSTYYCLIPQPQF